MTTINDLRPFLGELDKMYEEARLDEKTSYVQPVLNRLGAVSLVLIRETVAPFVVRNEEQEMTDTTIDGIRVVRAVPGKFKHRDRNMGLRIAREYNVGGLFPQNRTAIVGKPHECFDLNSFLFGDSANGSKTVYPVKSAVMYSDGLSLAEYHIATGKTFHNRASEDGTLWDAQKGQNSNNLFERHFVLPGTSFVQIVTTIGRVLPPEIFDHLLCSVSSSGAYGGQTSMTGVNIRTRIAAVVAGKFETPLSSPYELWRALGKDGRQLSGAELTKAIESIYRPHVDVLVDGATAEAHRNSLMEEIASGKAQRRYKDISESVSSLFAAWFK